MNLNPKSVLVVDDEAGVRMALQANFENAGWKVETAYGVTDALWKFKKDRFSLVVSDVRMPDGDGLNVMRTIRQDSPRTPVVLLTAYGSVPEAVQAIQDGACDYLMKPVCFEQLSTAIERLMSKAPPESAETNHPYREIIGNSPSLLMALDRARSAARTDADVLIEAESGTGKELLARFIHDVSPRRDKPLVAVNCAALPEHLLETELFGYVRGAYTGAVNNRMGKFEQAQGGTLLLDEIGEMPIGLQPKLLRALQEREFERVGDSRTIRVDIRVVATTNVSLLSRVGSGSFRADLYYRLNVIPITLPPLRKRKEDIPVLAQHFAATIARRRGCPLPALHPDFLAGLQQHSWPGNVRELGNYILRVMTLNAGEVVGPQHLSPELLGQTPAPDDSDRRLRVNAGSSIRDVERQLLEQTLEATGGNRTRAAEILGVSIRTIRNKIREFGLPPRKYA